MSVGWLYAWLYGLCPYFVGIFWFCWLCPYSHYYIILFPSPYSEMQPWFGTGSVLFGVPSKRGIWYMIWLGDGIVLTAWFFFTRSRMSMPFSPLRITTSLAPVVGRVCNVTVTQKVEGHFDPHWNMGMYQNQSCYIWGMNIHLPVIWGSLGYQGFDSYPYYYNGYDKILDIINPMG